MHATHILWHAAGQPQYPAGTPGLCRVCGEQSRGVSFAAWVADTFTNYDGIGPGDILCHICQFAFAQRDPELTRRTGKDKLQRMQNYSHIVCNGEWHPLHKGQKTELLDLLRRGPELAVIAVSGQKHLVFRARPGWWQVEEQAVWPGLAALEECLAHVGKLYRVYSKTEIETEQYSPGRTMQYAQSYGIDDYLATVAALRKWRGGPYLSLALYLAQKADDDEQDDTGPDRLSAGVSPGAESPDPPVARPERRVQGEVRTQHLGPVRGQHPSRGVHEQPEQDVQLTLL